MSRFETDASKDESGARLKTLRIVDLLSTRVQAVHLELIGVKDAHVARLGTALVYLPFLAIGYLLVLASWMRLAALATGLALAAALFGCGHVAIGAWGMARGRTIGTAECYDVVDPITDSDADPRGDAGEAPAGQGALAVRPSLPEPNRMSGDLLDFTRSRLGGGYALLRGGTKFE
jgi:hypothetical protein